MPLAYDRRLLQLHCVLTDVDTEDSMANQANRSFMSWALWSARALLALLFLMSGVSKLFSPVELLGDQFASLPGMFMRFIGAIEVLGAVGLILPALLRILPS
jgi:uncharacterized membrane protein YphA (DoxX/SURF4 family)